MKKGSLGAAWNGRRRGGEEIGDKWHGSVVALPVL